MSIFVQRSTFQSSDWPRQFTGQHFVAALHWCNVREVSGTLCKTINCMQCLTYFKFSIAFVTQFCDQTAQFSATTINIIFVQCFRRQLKSEKKWLQCRLQCYQTQQKKQSNSAKSEIAVASLVAIVCFGWGLIPTVSLASEVTDPSNTVCHWTPHVNMPNGIQIRRTL